MATFVYHNNQHRSNHHTVALSGYPESSKDPIASQNYPFQGIFYNKLYDTNCVFIGEDNSYNWWSSLTTVKAHSATWEKYITTYTTVCANSGFWDLGWNAYNLFYSSSANWVSTDNTLAANINDWNLILEPNKVYSNQVQEYTKQKTFKDQKIIPTDPNNIIWNLSAGQVITYSASANSYFSDFEGNKKGGIYNIIIYNNAGGSTPPVVAGNIVSLVDNIELSTFDGDSITLLSNPSPSLGITSFNNLQIKSFNNDDIFLLSNLIMFGVASTSSKKFVSSPLTIPNVIQNIPSQINIEFNINKYKFPNNINTFNIQGGYVMKFQFLSDGEFLHGKYNTYDLGIVGDQFVYYSGDGVILYVGGNPVQFVQGNGGDEISPESNGGIIVHGVIPYSNGDGILIV